MMKFKSVHTQVESLAALSHLLEIGETKSHTNIWLFQTRYKIPFQTSDNDYCRVPLQIPDHQADWESRSQ